jgi:hypothetical protein
VLLFHSPLHPHTDAQPTTQPSLLAGKHILLAAVLPTTTIAVKRPLLLPWLGRDKRVMH